MQWQFGKWQLWRALVEAPSSNFEHPFNGAFSLYRWSSLFFAVIDYQMLMAVSVQGWDLFFHGSAPPQRWCCSRPSGTRTLPSYSESIIINNLLHWKISILSTFPLFNRESCNLSFHSVLFWIALVCMTSTAEHRGNSKEEGWNSVTIIRTLSMDITWNQIIWRSHFRP